MVGADCETCAYNVEGDCTRGNYTYYQEIVVGQRCPFYERYTG